MKLVEISRRPSCSWRKTKPVIHMNNKGMIWFTITLADELHLEDGAFISFFQDEDSEKDFWIKRGGNIKIHRNRNYVYCGHVETIRKIFKVLDLNTNVSYSFFVGLTPTEHNGELYHPIFTSKPF